MSRSCLRHHMAPIVSPLPELSLPLLGCVTFRDIPHRRHQDDTAQRSISAQLLEQRQVFLGGALHAGLADPVQVDDAGQHYVLRISLR